ncbi:MAG: M81 family metallopeptidase, partial [Eubacteriales bacterium]|nr:M81 family metallopeptidase [Eubacteriales bacterium]
MKKILMLYFSHESNTFTPLTTRLSDYVVKEADDMLPLVQKAADVLRAAGYAVVPSIYAAAGPSGVNQREVYEYVAQKVSQTIDAHPEIAGVWMHLHGAIYVEEIGHA